LEKFIQQDIKVVYDFWKHYQEFLSYDQALAFDYRLDNIVIKLNDFFQRLIVQNIEKEEIRFFLAGSCIKSDVFRDLDMIFPVSEDRELINNALNKDFFEYENNSYTYRYKNDIYQLVFREKFKDASLEYLVDGFDMRVEFVNYINTKVNNLHRVSVNPFVSLQRSIHFLKRGDDVPYSVFLDICSAIADLKIKENEDVNKHFTRLQGNPNKLENIKDAISHFIEDKKEDAKNSD
jgi:hypothetical protein